MCAPLTKLYILFWLFFALRFCNFCITYFTLVMADIEATVPSNDVADTQGFELSPEARAQADLKFTYVVTCQIYGKQKEEQKQEAADIALLMQQ